MNNLLNIQGIEAFGFFGFDERLSGEESFFISDEQMLGYLEATRKCVIGPGRKRFDYAMENFSTPNRMRALKALRHDEYSKGKPAFFAALAELYDDGSDLGKFKIRIPKKLKEIVKVATGVKILEKAASTKIGKKITSVGKKVLITLNKVNPATLLIRNALRGLIALNFLGLATILASEKGKGTRKKVENMYKILGGELSKLNKSIENGKSKKPLFNKDAKKYAEIEEKPIINGLGVIATTGLLVSAGAFVLKIWDWIKQKGISLKKVGQVIGEKVKDVIGKKEDNPTVMPLPQETSENTSDTNNAETESKLVSTSSETSDEDAKKKRRRNIIIGTTLALATAGVIYGISRRNKKTKENRNPNANEKLGKVKLN